MARILVIEDNATNLKLIVLLLEGAGHTVTSVADAEAGIARAHAEQPDLILMDIQLPGMDGLAATRLLKHDAVTRAIPVIALTALAMKGDEERIRAAGCDGYIAKPMRYRDFLASVAAQLAARTAAGPEVIALTQRRADLIDRVGRVLIVDDERQNRQLLEAMLSQEGLVLLTAASGEDALAVVARDPPDLILLDVMMPGMDGYQVAAAIKGNPATKSIPIIMITALDDRSAKMRGLGAGAEDFLTKPVDHAELRARVRNLLRLKAYGDYHDRYSHLLEAEVGARTADLRHERDRAQRYLDTAGVSLVALDGDGRITLINRHASAVLGWTSEELRGRDWIDTCVPVRLRSQLRERLPALLAGTLPVFENWVLTRAGAERLVEWQNSLVRDDAGRVTGSFCSGTDITERHRAVEALRITEERMRVALQSANLGIWDLDFQTGVLRWSAVLEHQYGLKTGAFGGTLAAFFARTHPDDRDAVRAAIDTAARTGGDFSIEHRSLSPEGIVRWLRSAGRVHLGEHREPIRGVGISEDITERRTLEGQVRQAQKMEAVGQLASGVAHDFNNLLTVILGFADFVAAGVEEGSANHRDMGEIINAAHRAAGLTNQLLAFSRQQVLHAAPLDVNRLITDMTGMFSRLIGEHIHVVLALAPSLPLAQVDRSQLEQVVMNLVVNARDAMPQGGKLTLETQHVELENSAFHEETVVPGHYVMISVADTGTGMTKQTQRRLFEPFFTTKDLGKGTGLGLSTTYGIVKQSKGYLWVYSEIGLGTAFKIYLPRATAAVAAASASAAAHVPAKRGSELVLLVEDEQGVRQLARRILDQAGYRVLEAADGEDAERIFAAHAHDINLVVTDIVMPGIGGPELLGRLQAREPSLKVLYMSGYTEQSSVQRAGLDRGLPFVQKPFTAASFVQHVRDALDR